MFSGGSSHEMLNCCPGMVNDTDGVPGAAGGAGSMGREEAK